VFTLLASCRSSDPFKKEIQNSTLDTANRFLDQVLHPRSKKDLLKSYTLLSRASRNVLPEREFLEALEKNINRTSRGKLSPWEKFELSDGSALVYILNKYNYNNLLMKYREFSIYKVQLIPDENGFSIDLSRELSFSGMKVVASGIVKELGEKGVAELRQKIRRDADDHQFQVDLKSRGTQEDRMVEKCLNEGEAYYDAEEYRKSLVQFQKALGIDPENQKAQTYIERCKKALQFGLNG
jgi:tetratricopeptide (TPR) repeat protein